MTIRRIAAVRASKAVMFVSLMVSATVVAWAEEYAVKFICGRPTIPVVARGTYFTAINVHNPGAESIRFKKKIAIALPGERAGRVSSVFEARLRADEALEIDCPDILEHAHSQGFLKGFVLIDSEVDLDVVSVYTAAGSTGQVETLFIERVPARCSGTGKLPDLVPVNPQPSGGTSGYCDRDSQGRLRVTVRNQGGATASASTTTVAFPGFAPVTASTPSLAAGTSVTVTVPIPSGCFRPDCAFRITIDSDGVVSESDEANNTADGVCIG